MGRPRNQTPLADRVLDALRRAGHSCTLGELAHVFLGVARVGPVVEALDDLVERGDVERIMVEEERPWREWARHSTHRLWRRWEYRIAQGKPPATSQGLQR